MILGEAIQDNDLRNISYHYHSLSVLYLLSMLCRNLAMLDDHILFFFEGIE